MHAQPTALNAHCIAKHVIYTIHVYTCFIVCNLTVYIVFVDILSLCSLSFLFCLFLLPYHSSSMCFYFGIFTVIN